MSTMPRLLLTGCHGRLGQHVLRRLLPSYRILGLGRDAEPRIEHPSFEYRSIHGVSQHELGEIFREFEPESVLNAAAWTDVDGAETKREACRAANLTLVETLATLAERHGAYLCHVSTDYVFDGTAGPYEVDAPRRALGWYAQTKLDAERELERSGARSGIVRTLVLYGKAVTPKPDFVGWVVRELSAARPVRVVRDQWGNACWAEDLAQACEAMLAHAAEGAFHAASPEILSRFELARLAAIVHGLDADLISPITSAELDQKAPRPHRSGLVTARTETALGVRFHPTREALAACRDDDPATMPVAASVANSMKATG
jgi:dTDP-4-dehydrorhamnose reductase